MLLLGAGGISDGTAAAAALRAGADGVWVGTALVAAVEANAHPEYKRRLVESPGNTLRTNAFGPEWPDQPYRLLATPVVRDANTSIGGTNPERPDTIGQTRLFPHSVNMPYDIPKRSALRPLTKPAVIGSRWPTLPAKGWGQFDALPRPPRSSSR
jgi:nitronate monooxygenase